MLTVPVIDVHNDNFNELWPALMVAIKTSSFIALDTELSGLGNRKSLVAESIEDRYKSICHAARSRSILSLGIACYRKRDQKAADTYLVQVYNLTLLCSEEYIIEPQSVQFLVHHGFDFNKQYSHGIPYCKGNNKGVADYCGVHIRALFVGLLRARKPLVLHNGLIDMAFLYQCFYAQLPERLVTFTADLSEMFPAGLYDTKYVTEFELRLTASYLEYAYKKCKLDNSRSVTSGSTKPHVHIEFCQYSAHMSTYVDYRECPAVDSSEGKSDICQRFSAFGWCPNGTKCPLSHNTDLIVLQDEKGKDDKKKRKRRKAKKRGREEMTESSSAFDGIPVDKMPNLEEDKMPNLEEDKKETSSDQQQAAAEPLPDTAPPVDMDGNSKHDQGQDMKSASEGNGTCEDKADLVNPETTAAADENRTGAEDRSDDAQRKKADTGTHRAGYDAYMTGYIFAFSCALHKKEEVRAEGEEVEQAWHPDCVNKIYLSGKAVPLNIVKSTFSKSSKAHVQKMEMVWGGKI